MTTGNEPSLPQPSDDNAPMISGRGTKIIADARGAYLAGNLRALTELMTPDQEQGFREAVLDAAAAVLRTALTAYNLNDPSLHPALEALIDLIDHPHPDKTVRVLNCFTEPEREADLLAAGDTFPVSYEALRPIGGLVMLYVSLVRGTPAVAMNLWSVVTMAARGLRGSTLAMNHWWAGERLIPQQLMATIERWLVELAWALLIGKPIPAFEDASKFGTPSLLG
jgi:hypothetical protein